jgi:hypothetical protein
MDRAKQFKWEGKFPFASVDGWTNANGASTTKM